MEYLIKCLNNAKEEENIIKEKLFRKNIKVKNIEKKLNKYYEFRIQKTYKNSFYISYYDTNDTDLVVDTIKLSLNVTDSVYRIDCSCECCYDVLGWDSGFTNIIKDCNIKNLEEKIDNLLKEFKFSEDEFASETNMIDDVDYKTGLGDWNTFRIVCLNYSKVPIIIDKYGPNVLYIKNSNDIKKPSEKLYRFQELGLIEY